MGVELDTYNRKRDFRRTPEPRGERAESPPGFRYLIQKHAASHLHYDFRLELGGVLKSWAVPKGPSLNPLDKRLAVATEDHPLDYGDFEGTIPRGEYGGGTVMLWDTGEWRPLGDAARGLARGALDFVLQGKRLKGRWHLTRLKGRRGEKRENWLLIKGRDQWAEEDGERLLRQETASVVSAREMAQIAGGESEAFDVPAGARRAAMPEFVAPQLATLVEATPEGDDWLHEIKYDGYRLQLHRRGDMVRCFTRSGLDWTERFPSLAQAGLRLPVEEGILDGELVVLNHQGVSDFSALQQVLDRGSDALLHYYAFDLLYANGHDCRPCAQVARKQSLARLLAAMEDKGPIRYSDHIIGRGGQVHDKSCALALEGIISKRADATYRSGRGHDWLKSKCSRRQEFVIGGFTEPARPERGIGALLLGYYHGTSFYFAGKVGTGFSNRSGSEVRRRLDPLIRDKPAFATPLPADVRRHGIWVKPQLVCEVAFTEWTEAGSLRHPAFIALRADKKAADIRREQPDDAVVPPAPLRPLPEIRLTHPEKLLWPEQGLTKQDAVDYYHLVAERMLPYVINRPLSLVRCPEGSGHPCFYQRHQGKGFPRAIKPITIDGERYLSIADEAGLLSLVQVGALEIHPWGARNDAIERPDMLVFDMDPAEDVPFARVHEAADEARQRLEALGLSCFLKVTGGKGVHVVVPLKPQIEWPQAKAFAHGVALAMEGDSPQRYVSKMTKARRHGKIFVDYLRNDRTATAIAPYSTRARAEAPVALPIGWDELPSLPAADYYRVSSAAIRLSRPDPWADFDSARRPLSKIMLKTYG